MPSEKHLATDQAAWSLVDRSFVLCIALLGVLVLCAFPFVAHAFLPAGDATILFQFSRNLAHTGAITFVPSGPHAEGATDFAWMVLIALGIKLGIAPLLQVALLSMLSLVGIAVLLLKLANRPLKPLPVLFLVGVFALMPQLFSAALGFSAYAFAFLLVLLAYSFLQQNDVATPLVALVLCLFRPDGIVFAAPVLVTALILFPRKQRCLLRCTLLFVLPGLVYFFWRWHYFGQMLPLPFYVKSNTPRLLHLVVESSVADGRRLGWFSAIVLVFALRGHMTNVRNRAVLLCFMVLPTCFYFAMRLDQDIALRFFVYMPTGVAILLAMNYDDIRPRLPMLLKLGLAAWVLLVCKPWVQGEQLVATDRAEQAASIGEGLARLPAGTLITTEAGELPYYSHWTSYDAWGLNTAAFAHRLFQPSDVAAIHPDLILVYISSSQCSPQSDWRTPYKDRDWENLTRNIIAGADPAEFDLMLSPVENDRTLARAHIEPWQGEQFCWFVRRDSPLHDGIVGVLKQHHALSGAQYATLSPPVMSAPAETAPPPTALQQFFRFLMLPLH